MVNNYNHILLSENLKKNSSKHDKHSMLLDYFLARIGKSPEVHGSIEKVLSSELLCKALKYEAAA